MKHTKGEIKIGYNESKIQIYSDNNGIAEHICELPDQSKKSEVNAERIVRCWNMHDELLEALQEFMSYWESDFFRLESKDARTQSAWLAKASQAIIKATQ